jgi:hypothetical protein
MTRSEISYTIAGVLIGCLGTWKSVGFWRNTAPDSLSPPAWWKFDPVIWRGIVRAYPSANLVVWLMVTVDVIGILTSPTEVYFAVPVVLLGLGIGLFAATAMSSFVWNRPKWVVPPHLRKELGAVAEWKMQRERAGLA